MSDVIDLPRPLQPWQQWLGWFDAELAQQVGELVRRLADLVGTAATSGRGGQPEPDGLGDLRSRGPYERLLVSEWLLAEELPDEFLRRAAASEHLFLAPRMRAARVERSVVAVFDCGPRALGAARAAHLAAWILLARRAEEQGGTLRWGVLQEPGPLRAGDAPPRLGELMKARRFEAATAQHAEQWRAALRESADAGQREVWWIVAPGPGLPDGSLRDERVLSLQVQLAGDALDARLGGAGTQRVATLPLPPAADITTLLRGDFKTRVAAPRLPTSRTLRAARMSLTQGLILSSPPGHVGVPQLGKPALLVFAVPRAGQGKLAKPRRQEWTASGSLLAMGLRGREGQAVVANDNMLHFWQVRGIGLRARPDPAKFHASTSTGRVLPLVTLDDQESKLACVLDAKSQLVSWNTPGKAAPGTTLDDLSVVLDREVRVMAPLGPATMAYAMVWGDGIWLRQVAANGKASAMRRRLCPVTTTAPEIVVTVLGFGTPAAQIGSLACEHRVASGAVWQIFTIATPGRALDEVDGAQSTEVRVAPGERGVGLVNQRGTKAPALVVLSADKRRLRLVTPGSQTTLYESPTIIERCSVCQVTGHVAALTRDRRLVVLDPATLEALLIVTDDTPAHDAA